MNSRRSVLLVVVVTAASVSGNAIGTDLPDRAVNAYPSLAKIWVDAGFKNKLVEHGATLGVDVEAVTKDPAATGFNVVKRRWVAERTLGWVMQHRRLVRDYEARPDNSASMITIAMIDNLAKRRFKADNRAAPVGSAAAPRQASLAERLRSTFRA